MRHRALIQRKAILLGMCRDEKKTPTKQKKLFLNDFSWDVNYSKAIQNEQLNDKRPLLI